MTVTIQHPGTLDLIRVVTQGILGTDFKDIGPDTCTTGNSYAVGDTCSVNVQFQPAYPGTHRGAIVLSSGGSVIGVQFLYGVTTGSVGVIIPGLIRTIAGNNNFLYERDNIAATNAPIYLPLGEVVDAVGNLYLSDSLNHRIRKVDSTTHLITTYAGNGQPGFSGDNGLATNATITSPSALILDGAGNLYFADNGNNVIRKVDAVTHIITTVAGIGGLAGYNGDSQSVSLALLTQPNGLALDAQQNLYIADTGNNLIRKVDLKLDPSARVLTTIAGNVTPGFAGDGQPAAAAVFNQPWGIALGIDGNLYIADVNNNVIRRIDPTGSGLTRTVAGVQTNTGSFSGDGSAATMAHLQNPQGVAVDIAGNIYIADTQNNRIRKVNSQSGVISTIAGSDNQSFTGDGKNSDVATMSGPSSITLDASGNLYFGDMFHNRIRTISSNVATLTYDPIKNFRTSAPKSEIFENDGNADLTLQPLTFNNSALDPGSSTCPSMTTLTSGQSCTLGVEFAPAVANLPDGGAITSGTVMIPSDAANTPGVIGLSGNVLAVNPTTITVTSSLSPSALNAPVTFTATVTNGGNGAITGTVNFLDGSTTIGTGTLNVSGIATFTTSALGLGQHQISVTFPGDTNNAPSTSAPALNQIVKSATTLVLQSSPNPSTFSQNITFTAKLSGASIPVTGAITFSDGATALSSSVPNVSGDATFQTSTLAPGQHTMTASFSGDANNLASTATITQNIARAPTTATLTTSGSPVAFGTSVTFQITVTSSGGPTPTGAVTFNDGSSSIGGGVLNGSGTASLSLSTLTPGSHSITAIYAGDTNSAGSTSTTLIETVQKIATNAVVISDANPADAGATLNFTATVTAVGGTAIGGALTGSFTFYDGVAVIGTQPVSPSGAATLHATTLSVGSHTITALYSGSTNYETSTSPALSQSVRQATTTTSLTSSGSPSIAGKTVTLTATVSGSGGTPTGTVTFSNGSNVLSQSSVDARGQASVVVSSLTVGSHPITATYSGDANNSGSVSNSVIQAVNIAATYLTLTSSSNPIPAGVTLTLTATLTGEGAQPTGSITFRDGGTSLYTAAVNGPAPISFSTASLFVGSHTITAIYSGDANDAASTSPAIIEVVQQANTTTTLVTSQNPGMLNQPITLTANVSGVGLIPGGSITFQDGAAVVGTAALNASGSASLTASNLPLGSHSIVAIYSGDANHIASQSSALHQQILQTGTISIGSNVNPSVAGTNILFTARLAGIQNLLPTGTVTFKDGANILLGTSAVDNTGTAAFNTTTLAVGPHSIIASYSGDTNYKPLDSSVFSQTVLTADSNIALTTSANPATSGMPLTFTAVATGTGGVLTGIVTFEDGTTTLGKGSLNSAGVASFTTTALTPGIHAISAFYGGDSNNHPNSSAILRQRVQQATSTTLASNSNPALTLSPIVLTCTVANGGTQPASGLVTFTDGSQVLGSAALNANGVATLDLSSLSAGQHAIVATYSGDVGNFSSTSSPLAQTVQLRATTDVLTATSTSLTGGRQVTLISVIRWTGPIPPTGTASFKIGTTVIGTSSVDSAGVATLTIILDPGAATIVASYSGDSVYAASDSPATSVTDGPATNFTMHLSSSSLLLVSKQHITVDLTLSSIKGFSDDLSLGCLGLPFAATCTFSKVQPNLPSNGSQLVHVVVDTGSPLTAGGVAKNTNPLGVTSTATLCFLPCGALLGWILLYSRKRPLTNLLLVLCSIVFTLGLSGCGTLDLKGTPAGTYTFKITASGVKTGVTQSTDVTLTVRP